LLSKLYNTILGNCRPSATGLSAQISAKLGLHNRSYPCCKPTKPKSLNIIASFVAVTLLLTNCKPYKDPAPVDLGLTNPYCNNPFAVNFNWGFPGKPDNSVCIFPAEAFAGNYKLYDSITASTGVSSFNDSSSITLIQTNDSTLTLTNHCAGNSYVVRATKTLQFYVDSVTALGAPFCNGDTIAGLARKLNLADSIITYTYDLHNNGNQVKHKATLIKQ
jgi:hypothetical protein